LFIELELGVAKALESRCTEH